MKILLNNHTPFSLAHGGAQIQTEQTKAALEKIGVAVEYLRWWDESQTGDILHQVGVPPFPLVPLARGKGMKIAVTILLTGTCNRPASALFARKLAIQTALAAPLPRSLKEQLPWRIYHTCDRMIVGLEAERMVLEKVYGMPGDRVSVVPLGLSETFLHAGPASRVAEHLICSGTIGQAKNSLQLARLAIAARVPILFVGKPFDLDGAYWAEFSKLIDGKLVKHHPHVGTRPELVALVQQARGYVLMSQCENWSLAAHEAAGCGLPLLLPDQRWSRERFGGEASYFPKHGLAGAAAALRGFYDRCPGLPAPKVRLFSWVEAAEMLRDIYTGMLNHTSPPP